MAKPNTRATFIDYCKRALGHPVIEINVDDNQIDDRIDEAIQFYQEYHGEAITRNLRKHKVTNSTLTVSSSASFSLGEKITGATSGATATIVSKPSSTTITYNKIDVPGTKFESETITGTTSGASTSITNIVQGDIELGFITLPDSFVSVNNVMDIRATGSSASVFSVDYQMHLNDIFDMGGPYGGGVVNYEITKQYLSLVNRNINGIYEKIEYSRHKDRVVFYADTLHELGPDKYIIFDGYEVVDPDTFVDVYNDMFLKRYATALIKRQWGANLIKFEGMQLPGGVTLNGRQIFDDAIEEIKLMEEEMQLKYEMPPDMFIG
jgi:hypothetical protein